MRKPFLEPRPVLLGKTLEIVIERGISVFRIDADPVRVREGPENDIVLGWPIVDVAPVAFGSGLAVGNVACKRGGCGARFEAGR